eukprot:6209849-Pleurochrysis_carterae.AAC.2
MRTLSSERLPTTEFHMTPYHQHARKHLHHVRVSDFKSDKHAHEAQAGDMVPQMLEFERLTQLGVG